MDKEIFIVAGYKNASSTLQNTFKCMKTHNIHFENEMPNETKIILIPFRENDFVYKSAYFQDIIVPAYDYSPFNSSHFLNNQTKLCSKNCGICCECFESQKRKKIINEIDVNKLIEHYKTIDFDKYIFLNNKKRLEDINKKYNINLDYYSNEIQEFNIKIKNKDVKIISFNIQLLNDKFELIKNKMYNKKMENISLRFNNIGNEKWYKNKYNEFLHFFDSKNKN